MPHLLDRGQYGVFIGDIDAGGVVEEDDLGDATSLLALSAADRSSGGQQMGCALHRAGAWRGRWLEGGDVRWSGPWKTLAIPCLGASTILARGFYHLSVSEREVN